MSVLSRLASAYNRADEVPNEALAKEIAQTKDAAAVQELVDNLANPDKAIASDCIKVLYEVGALEPQLIAAHVDVFIGLLTSRNNRLVWGAMTALGAIADLTSVAIWRQVDVVIQATDIGSAITQDWGVRVLAAVSSKDATYEAHIFPFLKRFIKDCRPKDLARHAESLLVAVNIGNRHEILPILEARKSALRTAALKRLEKVIQKINQLEQ
jgi:hypothetical protein